MPCIKAFLLATVHLFGNVLPQQVNEKLAVGSFDPSGLDFSFHGDFTKVLSTLPEESLKLVLQHLPSFKDGIFEKNKNAIEVIHHTDPTMATSLVVAARHELYRRQGNISTPATPTPPPPPPPAPTVIVPVPITSTNSAGVTQVTTVTAVSSATASVVVPVTSTDSRGQTTVVQSSVPAVVLTQPNGQVTTTPAPTVGSTGVVLTQTNQQGSTFLTTFTPEGGVVSSLVLETTTLADGTRKTITSFAVVPASTGASAGGPRLQGSASRPAALTMQGLLILALSIGAFWL